MTNLFILLILIFVIFNKFNKFFYFIFYLFILICFLPVGQFLEYNLLSKKFYSLKNISNYDSVLVLGGHETRISHGLELIKKNKNSKIIFTGGNKPLKISEILYSEINSKESNNSEKEIFIKKQCLDLYPKEFLDLKNINGGKYIYDEASKVMKLSHTCVFKLDPS